MNREERRAISKDNKQRIDVTGIVVHFRNGQYVNLDLNKAEIVDKDTKRPLFDEILEPKPESQLTQSVDVYAVEFETPEGTMIFSKNGDFSGIKKK